MDIRPTYARIAARCGVNSSTVSRALNNHRSIPETTRRRIRAIAESMGWSPNPLASAYMAHLRATHPPSFKASLGVVVDFPMPRGVEDLPGHVRRIFRGAESRAAEYGYRVHAFSLRQEEMTPAKLDRTLFNRNVPGFIITGLRQPGRMLKGLNWDRYATVATGFSLTQPQVHRVVTDVMHGFGLVIDEAFALGYRRIWVAVSDEYDRRTG
jgi:LacI family transcriptional regulator